MRQPSGSAGPRPASPRPRTGGARASLQQAIALHQRGYLDDARSLYAEVLEAHPRSFDALHLLGVLHAQSGEAAQAVERIRAALAIDPRNALAHNNLGSALRELRQFGSALAAYERALELKGDYAEAHSNRGIVLRELGRPDEALASYERALALRPNLPQACFNRANLLRERGELAAALAGYNAAIALQPNDADAYYQRGLALAAMHEWQKAAGSFAEAVAIRPDHVDAHLQRGAALTELRDHVAALASLDRALALRPDLPDAWCDRGNVLRSTNECEAALESYERALALCPEHVQSCSNRGVALQDLGRLAAAIESFDRAIELAPEDAKLHFNRAFALLLQGDFARGWPEYEWRHASTISAVGKEARTVEQPLWLGRESLAGRTILLRSEQGLGDTLQFCRYAGELAKLGGHVILEAQRPLVGLLARLPGTAQVLAQGDPLPPFDYHCPLLSLPLAFGTDIASIPAAQGYLATDPDRLVAWQTRLGPRTRPRIGLVWSGSTIHPNDRNRSLPLATLRAVLPPGPEYVSVQREVRDRDRSALDAFTALRDVSDGLTDFDETAALCACLDLVVSVDTSVAHLSAALGRPTWILLPFSPDWRWLTGRDDSPWYASVRLYRQPRTGDWTEALGRLAADLRMAFP